MLIWWRIRFDAGEAIPATQYGYLVLNSELVAVGLYDDNGVALNGGTNYTTIDSGPSPTVGVTPPEWGGNIGA